MTDFKLLSDKEHIKLRFGLYGGSQTEQNEDVFINQKFSTLPLVSGLLKIISEIIDNSVDEYIRTNGQHATKIDVTVLNNTIKVQDNGRGIPAVLIDTPSGPKYQMVTAFTHARAGSNFDDEKREGMGTNGIGSMLTNVCSTEFEAWSCDGTTEVHLLVKDNEETVSTRKSRQKGTTVQFTPDYEFFGLTELTKPHIDMIQERVRALSLSFPGITFRFNGAVQKVSYTDYFGECMVFQFDNAVYSIGKSTGSFETSSIVNGLSVKSGSHIDYFWNLIGEELSEEIRKKHKVLVPKQRLKQHLRIHSVITGVKALRFDSQTKERVTNSQAEIKNTIGEINTRKIILSVLKNKELITEILAYSRLQEDLDAKKDLEKLEKKKRIVSDKYFPSVGEPQHIFICEGDSAVGSTSSVLGRKGNAYYALKGVPLNVLEVSHQKFIANKELSELYAILTSLITVKEKPQGADWYQIESHGQVLTVNINDVITIDGTEHKVKDLVQHEQSEQKEPIKTTLF